MNHKKNNMITKDFILLYFHYKDYAVFPPLDYNA